MTCCVQ